MFEQEDREEEARAWMKIIHKVPKEIGWFAYYTYSPIIREFEIQYYSYNFANDILYAERTFYGHFKALVNEVIRLNIVEVK